MHGKNPPTSWPLTQGTFHKSGPARGAPESHQLRPLRVWVCEGSPGSMGIPATVLSPPGLCLSPTRSLSPSLRASSTPLELAAAGPKNGLGPSLSDLRDPEGRKLRLVAWEEMSHGLYLHFPAQIFPKHQAFLFPLELLKKTPTCSNPGKRKRD